MSMGGVQKGPENITLAAMREVAQDTAKELNAEKLDSKLAMMQGLKEASNPFAKKLRRKSKDLKTHKSRIQKMLQMKDKGGRLLPVKKIKDSAQKFQKKNPELKAKILTMLRRYIKPGDSKKEILRKLQEFYPDVSLADEALEFLLETTEGELQETVQEAKEDLEEQSGREIKAGKNIAAEARSASKAGLGTPTSMRDMYRDITGNPRDSNALFSELSEKYAFKDLKKVIKFLFHSLGKDLKAKGPSIPKGMLHRLIAETRSLQAILGVYRFFQKRMGLVQRQFQQKKLDLPQQLTFEQMAKQFMKFVGQRYPSSDNCLQLASKLGIEKWILAKIIVLSQLRDAIREVAMKQIFRSVQHRDEAYMALIEALEDLEEELEELIDLGDEEEEDEEGEEQEQEEEDK